jgi:hypothetical protein
MTNMQRTSAEDTAKLAEAHVKAQRKVEMVKKAEAVAKADYHAALKTLTIIDLRLHAKARGLKGLTNSSKAKILERLGVTVEA